MLNSDRASNIIAQRMQELLEKYIEKQMIEDVNTNGWYYAIGFGNGFIAGVRDYSNVMNILKEADNEE